MAQKHLAGDEIEVIISAETAEAQQEIHALTAERKQGTWKKNARPQSLWSILSPREKELHRYRTLKRKLKYSKHIWRNNKNFSDLQ